MTEQIKKPHHPHHMSLAHAIAADKIIAELLLKFRQESATATGDNKPLSNKPNRIKVENWQAELVEAAERAGVNANLALVLFPELPKSLWVWLHGYGDSIMAEWLINHKPEKITATIYAGLEYRFKYFAPDRPLLRAFQQWLLAPLNNLTIAHTVTGAELTFQTADRLWLIAGDTSHDWNYYSKRLLLAGIMGLTYQVYLNDDSLGLEKTLKFLRARLTNVGQLNNFKKQAKNFSEEFWQKIFVRNFNKDGDNNKTTH